MSDPALPLQNAIETALRASATLKTAMGLANVRLYSMSAPTNALFPYVVIGEDQIIDDSHECSESSEVITTVHAWSRAADAEVVGAARSQAKSMAAAIRSVVKAIDTVTGFNVTLVDFESTRHLTDPDGLTAHAVVEHRFLLDPAPAP